MTDNNLLFVWDPAKSTCETMGAIYITVHPAKGNIQPQHINTCHPARWREEEASQAFAGRLCLIKKIQFVSSSFANTGV